MKLNKTNNSGFGKAGKEVVLVPPPPREVIKNLFQMVGPGQSVTGVKVVSGESPYVPQTELGCKAPVLRRFELHRIQNNTYSLTVEQNVREHRAASNKSGMHTHVNVQDPYYKGEWLFVGDEMFSGYSGKSDLDLPRHEEFQGTRIHDWDEMRDFDIAALETMRDDIMSGETQIRIADRITTRSFGEGFLINDVVERPA